MFSDTTFHLISFITVSIRNCFLPLHIHQMFQNVLNQQKTKKLFAVIISDRSDYGDGRELPNLSSVVDNIKANVAPTLPPAAGTGMAFALRSSAATSSSGFNQPPTVFNADDFLIMKATSECK